MAGGKIPGPHSDGDPPIDDGTLTRARSATPGPLGVITVDSQSKAIDISVFVFFFGGYKSTQPNVNSWLDSARKQRSEVTFRAFPYPEDAPPVPAAKVINEFNSAIDTIKNTQAGKIYIVGHSSGCFIANGVARRLKDMKNIVLVALDGFIPDAKQLVAPTQVWGAIGGKKGESLHYKVLKSGAGNVFNTFTAHDDCSTKAALHFSLVNTEANDKDLKTFDDIKNGYKGCVTNLCWLK